MSSPKTRSGRAAVIIAAALLLLLPIRTGAHEVPASVTLQTFVQPGGDVLRLLVRVPLEAMRDFDFPRRDDESLDISGTQDQLPAAAQVWIVDYVRFYEDGDPLPPGEVAATRISLPTDTSFRSYDLALAHILGPALPEETQLTREEAMLDVLIEYPIASDEARFSIHSELAHLGVNTTTILRFDLPGSEERLFQFSGFPGLVELDPSWYQAVLRFVEIGFFHILEGIDHLLFIFCLVIPFRKVVPLVAIITSFTVAHSITLAASAFGYVPDAAWFPPLVEVLIALSIVYMAVENIIGVNLQRRWLVAFGFGLVHGFGFSFLLRESLQFAGSHLITSLLAFNIGVELGQIFVLVLVAPLLGLLFRHVMTERMGVALLSALIAHTAWHWMGGRWAELRTHSFEWPALDAAFLMGSLRWVAAILILAGVAWALFGVYGRIDRLKGAGGPAASS